MSQEEERDVVEAYESSRNGRRGFLKTAWIVIAILVVVSMLLQRRGGEDGQQASVDLLQQRVLDVQGKYLVAASQLPGPQANQLYDSVDTLRTGPLFMRLRHIVLAGELVGADEALAQADAVAEHMAQSDQAETERETTLLETLQSLYTDYQEERWDAPSLDSAARQLLRDNLGWFGELALAPKRPVQQPEEATEADSARAQVLSAAWRTFAVVLAVTFSALGAGLAGLIGAVLFLTLMLTRRIRSALATGSDDSAIYAETFAVWMLLLLVLSAVGGLVGQKLPNYRVLINAAASVLSLAALLWPTVRGVPWSRVRGAIGLTRGKGVFRESFWGLVCYLSNIPVLMIGLLVTFALMGLQSALTGGSDGLQPVDTPTHPVVQWVQDAGWLGRAQIFALACLIAPLVEEIVFRGVLYRHLREATCGWSTGISITVSVGVTSLIFAMIHPQGLLAIPALMAVATGLSLAREWRGSLLAAVTMHAANNGVLMLLLFTLV